MATDSTDYDAIIDAVASGPAEAENDGMKVRQHPLPELFKAQDRQTTKEAAAQGRLPFRTFRMIPPDTAT